MRNRLIIIGAGGHGKVIADIAMKNGYTNIGFVDDRASGMCMGFPIVGICADMAALNDGNTDFVIAVGNNRIRRSIAERFDVSWAKLIHPSAQIGYGVTIGVGTVIMAGAVVNPDASIGRHCIINTAAVIEHDNMLGNYVHVSPNAALGGTVAVGECTHIGVGAAVRNNISICEDCVIGAGAAVVRNITEAGTYMGAPAKKKE